MNNIKLIGLLTILICFWLILYLIPEIFISLFNTLLGKLILILIIIITYINNKFYSIVLALLIITLYRFGKLNKEGLTMQINGEIVTNDDKKTFQDFLAIQNTINKNKIFDMEIINSQTSKEEFDYFNKNGIWPWSKKVIKLYQDAIKRNPYIRNVPEQATNYARTIYNETAILRILSYQTKEGDFLLNGILITDPSGNKYEELPSGFGNFPYKSGLLNNRVDDIIKCNMDDENNPTLERISYTGKGIIYGEQTEKITPVDYNNLENIIPGFSFINKPCNPCLAIASNPDYSCPFELKVKEKPNMISSVWKYLWNI